MRRGPIMSATKRAIFLSLSLALAMAVPAAAVAQQNPSPCSSTAQCPDGMSCQPGFLGLKYCLFEYCNVDTDCSRPGAQCTNGICRRPGGGGGGGGGGLGQSGPGGRCGPQRLGGGVIKSIGCKAGLQCRFGFCEQLR